MAYSDVAPVRMLEVHDRGPVVGFIFNEATGGAGGNLGDVVCEVH
jgi:hypothetical protein